MTGKNANSNSSRIRLLVEWAEDDGLTGSSLNDRLSFVSHQTGEEFPEKIDYGFAASDGLRVR